MASYEVKKKTYDLIHRTMLDMIADLQLVFNQSAQEEDDMIKVHVYFKNMHSEMAYKHVLEHIYPHKKAILARDLLFFIENAGIFSGLPAKELKYYSRQITGKRLSEENKEAIWDYLEVMILYVERVLR